MGILSVESVTFRYPLRTALESVSADIPGGSVSAILGPNGAGKTTLLNILLGWLRPSGGTVRFRDRPIGTYSRRELGLALSLVPQSEHIPFEYSVLEYVILGRAPHLGPLQTPGAEDERIALAALGRVGMSEYHNESVTRLSAGEQQLVLVARSLAQEPSVLLMDEPSAHLDISNRRRLITVIRDAVADRMTVVLTVHDPDFAAACADHVILMRDGRVLESGGPATTMTGDALSRTYGTPIRTVRAEERTLFLW